MMVWSEPNYGDLWPLTNWPINHHLSMITSCPDQIPYVGLNFHHTHQPSFLLHLPGIQSRTNCNSTMFQRLAWSRSILVALPLQYICFQKGTYHSLCGLLDCELLGLTWTTTAVWGIQFALYRCCWVQRYLAWDLSERVGVWCKMCSVKLAG